MFQSVRRYALEAGLDDPVVCYQGAVVAEPVSGKWLRHVPMPLEPAREAIRMLSAQSFRLNCYVRDELYVEKVTAEARRYAHFMPLWLIPHNSPRGRAMAFRTSLEAACRDIGENDLLVPIDPRRCVEPYTALQAIAAAVVGLWAHGLFALCQAAKQTDTGLDTNLQGRAH